MISLDTNLLTRLTRASHPHGAVARLAIHKLLGQREQLAIVPQSLYEFWAVATRNPGQRPVGENGLGFTTSQASQWLNYFQRRFILLPDRDDLVPRWHNLVKTYSIRGFRAHDARLVAAIQSYGLSHLLTFNGADFKDLPIAIVDPASL